MSSFEISAPPVGMQTHEQQRQPQRYAGNFGGAVTHRDVVQEKLRVDPAAVAERMGRTEPRPPPRSEARAMRLAEEDAAYERRREERPGQHVDIEA